MKSVYLKDKGVLEYAPDLIEVPQPRSGQVLIKVECAVINPSDIYMMQGDYNGEFKYPLTPGAEGSGTVVASGGGLWAWSLVGKRVGFTRMAERGGKFTRGGSYAEYIVTNAYQCVTLDDNVSWEQGACSFVNPITAVGLLDRCKHFGATAVIQTGAASSLGRMIIKLFREQGVTLVNIVRRKEQVELLKKEEGADHVLNSTDEDFDEQLKKKIEDLNCTVALEAVSGEMPGRILQFLPRFGVCISYGQLSEKKIGPMNPAIFIFKSQRLESFLLPTWLSTKSLWGQWGAMSMSKPLVQKVVVSKCFGLHQIHEALEFYKGNMTAGKVFLKPSLTE